MILGITRYHIITNLYNCLTSTALSMIPQQRYHNDNYSSYWDEHGRQNHFYKKYNRSHYSCIIGFVIELN